MEELSRGGKEKYKNKKKRILAPVITNRCARKNKKRKLGWKTEELETTRQMII